jgi:hypothetical protein
VGSNPSQSYVTTDGQLAHECTAFYNCHAAGIEVAMSNSSSVVTGMTLFSDLLSGNDSFAAIRYNGNYSFLISVAAET